MSLQTRLSDLATAIATDIKQIRVAISGASSGSLNGLVTTDKSSLIAAINEAYNRNPAGPTFSEASTTAEGVIEIATLAEVATGTDSSRAVTPEGVRQERTALKAEILGAGIPAALDTLAELDAALGNDANFAGTMTTALGNRLRIDINNQGLTVQQKANGQQNLNVIDASSFGNPDTDLVAVYSAAKA